MFVPLIQDCDCQTCFAYRKGYEAGLSDTDRLHMTDIEYNKANAHENDSQQVAHMTVKHFHD